MKQYNVNIPGQKVTFLHMMTQEKKKKQHFLMQTDGIWETFSKKRK